MLCLQLFSGFWHWWGGTGWGSFWLCDKFLWKPVCHGSVCSGVCAGTASSSFSLQSYSVAVCKSNFVGMVVSPRSRELEFGSSAGIKLPEVPGSFTYTAEISRSLFVSQNTRCCSDTGKGLSLWVLTLLVPAFMVRKQGQSCMAEKWWFLCLVPLPCFRALVVFQEWHLHRWTETQKCRLWLWCVLRTPNGWRPLSLTVTFLCSLNHRLFVFTVPSSSILSHSA